MLKKFYGLSSARIKCGINLSDLFPIKCGVKQGGILSPFLYNSYINDLFVELCNLNIGASIYGLILSSMGYADDVSLLDEDAKEVQKLQNLEMIGLLILVDIKVNSSVLILNAMIIRNLF